MTVNVYFCYWYELSSLQLLHRGHHTADHVDLVAYVWGTADLFVHHRQLWCDRGTWGSCAVAATVAVWAPLRQQAAAGDVTATVMGWCSCWCVCQTACSFVAQHAVRLPALCRVCGSTLQAVHYRPIIQLWRRAGCAGCVSDEWLASCNHQCCPLY
jgi:hypothetical protein